MPIPIEVRYKVGFEHHRFVSEYRLSLLRIWGTAYLALAAVFVWTQVNAEWVSPIITFLASILTFLLWFADRRHAPAIRALKDSCKEIEQNKDAEIPEAERYFTNLNKGMSHTAVINAFAGVMVVLLLLSTVYLFCHDGHLPRKANWPSWEYKVVTGSLTNNLPSSIEQAATNGWELMSVATEPTVGAFAVMRRTRK